jgi:hypothetical protein
MNEDDIIIAIEKIGLETMLLDLRVGREQLALGTIEGLAKQYGIKTKIDKNRILFAAPKKRMQHFAEKLHFGGIDFVEQ